MKLTLKYILTAACALPLFSCGKVTPGAVTVEGFALGTIYQVTVADNAPDSLRQRVEALFAEADSTLSVFNPNSLLSRLNRNETDRINEDIRCNIELARKVSEISNGRYDITVQPLVEAYGFMDAKQEADVNVDSLLQYVGYKKLHLHGERLTKDLPEIRIDLNSVAKGYTVDQIARMLEESGSENYLVNVGGEIFCRGLNPAGERWRIAIDTPYEGNYTPGASASTILGVSDAGVATSGNYRNFHTGPDGKRYTHIINPLTGENTASRLLSATVIADSCALADALGTMFMALGPEDSLALLESQPDLAVLLIYSGDGGEMEMHITPRMQQYIQY